MEATLKPIAAGGVGSSKAKASFQHPDIQLVSFCQTEGMFPSPCILLPLSTMEIEPEATTSL
jgi:hypothetical protein